jgi:hypothetical protein
MSTSGMDDGLCRNSVQAAEIEMITVSSAMKAAGMERAREVRGEEFGYAVAAIYLAMEYERLGVAGQLSSFDKQALKVR